MKIDLSKDLNFNTIFSDLHLESMKANYPGLVKNLGFAGANGAMELLYSSSWPDHKETIWQWYDSRGDE